MGHKGSTAPVWHFQNEFIGCIVFYLLFMAKLCFGTNDFFIAAKNNVCNKQRADKDLIIESTVILISRASLTLIKECSLVVIGDNDNLKRAVTLDQIDMLPWKQGSVSLLSMWRMQDRKRRRRSRRRRRSGEVKMIYIQQSAGSQSCIVKTVLKKQTDSSLKVSLSVYVMCASDFICNQLHYLNFVNT